MSIGKQRPRVYLSIYLYIYIDIDIDIDIDLFIQPFYSAETVIQCSLFARELLLAQLFYILLS